MAKSELTRLSAVELARLIRTKKASPVEVTEAHLAAIGRINPAVNAFCTVAAEKALAWAREAERAVKKRAKLGTLHGVPVAIKDLTITAGIRTTFGSTLYRDHVPTEDAEVVRRLKAAGAIVLGKTNTPEFGAGANTVNKVFGATRNPCSPLSPLSCTAPWRSAREAVAKARSPRGLRLAYAPDIADIGVNGEIEQICRTAAHDLRDAGASVDEIEINMSDGRDAFIALRGEAMAGNHLQRLERIGELDDNLAGNIRAGFALTATDLARAEHKRAEIWHRWRGLFEKYDLVLTPTAPVPPFPVEKNYPEVVEGRKMRMYMDWIGPTFLVSLAALPAASVPAGLTSAKLPVGLQIVGPRFSEPLILSAAKFVEEVHPIGVPPNCG